MARRSRYRLALTALLVPLALMIGLRSAWALYACRVDGVVRESCCCEGKHAKHRPAPAPTESRVAAASCCDVTIQSPSHGPDVRDVDRAHLQVAPAVMTVAPTVPPPPSLLDAAATIARSVARPPPVATFLIKQSFLR